MNLRLLRKQASTLWTLASARKPVYMILYLTARCNFRCPMCFYLEEINDPNKEEMAFPELEKLARSLDRLVQLSLTGGEPFLRHDIPEIVDLFVRHNRVGFVTIPTNGSLPERIEGTVERLVREYPGVNFRIPVSLDGYPADHDAIRGAKSYEKIERTMALLTSLRRRCDNLTVDINTCYSSLNQGKVRGLVEFVRERFDIDNHSVTYVRGNTDDAMKQASVGEYTDLVEEVRRRPNRRESRPFSSWFRAVMDYQRDIIRRTLLKDEMTVPCAAGRRMIVVNERAEVLPCEILNRKLGSLKDHDYDVSRVLATPEAVELVDWIRRTKCHCTFECALATSIIYHPASYPRVAWRAMKHWWRSGWASARSSIRPEATRGTISLPILQPRG